MQTRQQLRQEKFSMIEHWQQSGLTQKQYCQQQDIAYHSFHYWYKRYRISCDESKSGDLPFMLLTPSDSITCHTELSLPDGRRLIFHQPVAADFLKILLS